jgi:hypothetical protein
MRGGSALWVSACVLAACSMDLSGLQRSHGGDGNFNPAIDPDAGAAGESGIGAAGAAGVAGASGMTSNAGAAGAAGASGKAATSAGAPSMPPGAAGSTPPPPPPAAGAPAAGAPAAGAPAAGAPAPEPEPLDVAGRTCGLPSLPCCMPGNTCDIGACLRGKCTPYAGFYARTSACTANPCGSRNAYTAGCNCPTGFQDTLLWSEAKTCEGGESGTTEVRSCTSGRIPGIAYGGAWVEGPDSSCNVGCRTPNPITGDCSCPVGAPALPMTVDTTGSSCPNASMTLQLCVDADAVAINFGGAYAVSQSTASGCGAPNPLTGTCSCAAEVTMAQSLHVGNWSIFVCNL